MNRSLSLSLSLKSTCTFVVSDLRVENKLKKQFPILCTISSTNSDHGLILGLYFGIN